MDNWNIEKLLSLFKECGDIAMKYYENPPMELKADKSIVTAADKAIEERLAKEFDRPEQNVYLIGEETVKSRSEEYIANALNGTAWIVDPIDGTAPYSIQLPAWGTSIALMKNGVITEGAIYLPPQDDLLITQGNRSFRCKGIAQGNTTLEPFEATPQALNPGGVISMSQKSAKYGTLNLPNQVFAWSGCVASFYGIFTGRILAYLASLNLWDIAGALPLMRNAGLTGRTLNGKELDCNVNEDVYFLDSASPDRWKLKGYAVIAPNKETVNYVFNNTQLP
jgi:fructose-1,6-bisphosphatase/inositol monophosphatase family enzyme